MININDGAPDFALQNQKGKTTRLKDFRGSNVVLYFYPKDNTPGCTIEAREFSAYKDIFMKKNTFILGVSKDSVNSHKKFCEKQNIGIELLSDPDHSVIEGYGAWQKKKNYGKEFMGIVRSTFLIDTEGTIIKSWENVKVKGHIEEVLAAVP
jgi:peroxiredoxin Q/BCP